MDHRPAIRYRTGLHRTAFRPNGISPSAGGIRASAVVTAVTFAPPRPGSVATAATALPFPHHNSSTLTTSPASRASVRGGRQAIGGGYITHKCFPRIARHRKQIASSTKCVLRKIESNQNVTRTRDNDRRECVDKWSVSAYTATAPRVVV